MERKVEVPREVQLHGLRLATDPERVYGQDGRAIARPYKLDDGRAVARPYKLDDGRAIARPYKLDDEQVKIIENEQEDEPRD